ncbi:hypothetical protein [Sulfitobacter sp. AS59]|jgi:hypothetical protein|uniref:hypothetical protein n=1 Tax=Sulfitobacter sp. AS59 TaxID=3135784 RepID=UPI00316C1B3B
MGLIADILLAAGALGAAFYCFVLSKRLKHFNSLEQGVGGAVAVLSSRVDDLTKTLTSAQETAASSATTLLELTDKAEESSRRMELRMASLHDIPAIETAEANAPKQPKNGIAKEIQQEPMFMRHSKMKEEQ